MKVTGISAALAASAVGFICGAATMNARPGGQTEQRFKRTISKDVSCRYWLYLPKEYDQEKDRKWPLVLFLHGAGERGSELARVKIHGPPSLVAKGRDFPFILVSPQCPEGEVWSPDVLNALLDEVIATHRVDVDRVYCTGLSMGGYGTWDLAITSPERFAAIIPICGGGNFIRARQLSDVPIWAFHGAKDEVVPLSESERMIRAVKAAGGDPKLTVYPEADHNSWTRTYDNPEVYEWLLSQRRTERK